MLAKLGDGMIEVVTGVSGRDRSDTRVEPFEQSGIRFIRLRPLAEQQQR